MKVIAILGLHPYSILFRTEDTNAKCRILMPISEKQEKELEENSFLQLPNGFIIKGEKVVTYGEHNINTDEGKNYIDSINICSKDSDNWIYTDINFKTGEVFERDGKFYQTTTWNNVIWFKYNLCLIGNPKRVLIFDVVKKELEDLHNEFRAFDYEGTTRIREQD